MNAIHSVLGPVRLAPTTTSVFIKPWTSRAVVPTLLLTAIAIAFGNEMYVGVATAITSFGWLCYRYPWLIWLTLGLVLPITSRLSIGPGSVSDLLLLAALSFWLMQSAGKQNLRIFRHRALFALLLYLATAGLSAYFAQDLGEAMTEMIKWAQFALVVAIMPVMVPPQTVCAIIAGVLLAAVGQAVLGLYQFAFQVGPEWFAITGSYTRASGSFRQPNPFAGYLGLTLPLALTVTRWTFLRWQRRDRRIVDLALCICSGLAVIVIGLGLATSWSRGGWLGAAAGIVVVTLVSIRTSRAAVATVISVTGVAIVMMTVRPGILPSSIASRLGDLPSYVGVSEILSLPTTDENFSIQERVAHWAAAYRMWSHSPWLGVGAGNYAAAYPIYRELKWDDPLGHAHNTYLNVLAETGIVGFATFATVWIVLCVRSLTIIRVASSRSLRWALAAGLLGLFTHLGVHSLVDNLFVQGIYLHIAILVATLEIAPHDLVASPYSVC